MCTVRYSRFDDAINLVVRAEKEALMAKADIESAIRLLPVHPDDFNLLGIKFNGTFYFDKALRAIACYSVLPIGNTLDDRECKCSFYSSKSFF